MVREFIPRDVGVFMRGSMKSAKAPAVKSANNLLTNVIPVTPRVAALRAKLRLPPVRPMTFQQLRDSVANSSPLVYRSVYATVIATSPGELAAVALPTPIPRCIVRCADADINRGITQRVKLDANAYLTLAEVQWLQQRDDVTVECFDQSTQSLASIVKQADAFLPSALFDAYVRTTPESELYTSTSIARLCRFTMLDEGMVKKEIEHRMDVRASRRAGAIKAAITRAANRNRAAKSK